MKRFSIANKRLLPKILTTVGLLIFLTDVSSAFELKCYDAPGGSEFEIEAGQRIEIGFVTHRSVKCKLIDAPSEVRAEVGDSFAVLTRGLGFDFGAFTMDFKLTCTGVDNPVGDYLFVRETFAPFYGVTFGYCSKFNGAECSLTDQHFCKLDGMGWALEVGLDAGIMSVYPWDP